MARNPDYITIHVDYQPIPDDVPLQLGAIETLRRREAARAAAYDFYTLLAVDALFIILGIAASMWAVFGERSVAVGRLMSVVCGLWSGFWFGQLKTDIREGLPRA